ncbi:NifU family protein [Hoyosella altamirensis]|nr:NifU family protein [Hoyosella altamirensis]
MTSRGPEQWRTAGERIDALLDAMASSGPIVRERAEHLVREVVGLYGAALEQIQALAGECDDKQLLRKLADDDLVASLLLVHGLHPDDEETRVRRALDSVRPYLGSHGGDVDLIGIEDGVVHLRFQGTCKSCPSSAATLELAVEGAIKAAAPEVTAIEAETASPEAGATSGGSGVISPDSLFSKVHQHANWVALPELADLADGEVGGYALGGTTVLVCRSGADVFAFIDRCPHCLNSMAGAVLHRMAGAKAGAAVLRCPQCRTHYDIRRAGAGMDDAGEHLTPLPVLPRNGTLSVALPAGAGQ